MSKNMKGGWNIRAYNKYKYANKGLILVFLVAIAFIALSAVSTVSADSSVIYVNGSGGDDSWSGESALWNGTDGPKKSIKNATGAVNNSGTINIADGIYSGANNTNIVINKNLTIAGESKTGTIINGANTGNIFTIGKDISITIQNLTIINGSTTLGGAICNSQGGNLTVINSTFKGNYATLGGAIYNAYGGSLVVTDSNFTDNSGGAIFNSYSSNLTVSNTNFTGNSRYGAIYSSYGCNLAVSNCHFTGNSGDLGGAISNIDNCNLAVSNSTFTSNSEGGAIDNLNNCNLVVSNCIFTDNSGDSGGAISNANTCNLTVLNCIFTHNSGYFGGAIYDSNNYNTNITNNSFTGNHANYGGAISSLHSSNLSVTNNSIMGNTASYYGGVIYNAYTTSKFSYNRIMGNTAPNGGNIYCIFGSVNAAYNWWGSNTGPASASISGNVTYSHWITSNVTARANYNGGYYNVSKIITLTMNETGNIYYTTDGTTPTTASKLYNGSITIKSTTTLKYVALSETGDWSPVYTQTYTIDKTAPKVSSTSPKNGATGISRTGTIKIKFSEKIKASINWSKVVVKNKYGKKISISKSISGNYLNIKTSKRSSYSSYTVYIPACAVKDYAGNKIAKSYTFRFKTGKY